MTGCATPYQAKGFQGGYVERQLSSDEFWIGFEGNVGLDRKTLKQSLLRQAAEVTLQHGFTHFVVADQASRIGFGFMMTPTIFGPMRQTGRSIVIQCYPGNSEQHDAIDAKQFLEQASPAAKPESESSSSPHAL